MTSLGLPVSMGAGVAPKIDSFTFNAMTAGTVTQNVANFCLGLSQILGFTRTTPGGVIGNPYVGTISAVPAGGVSGSIGNSINLNSTNAGDTSVYTMFFTTPTLSGLLP